MFDCVGTGCDELVHGVVLVGDDEECAAEAGADFGDGAAEGVFVGTTPTRRGETCRAFIGLGPVRAVFVSGLDNAVKQRFLGATVGVGNDGVGDGAVGAERADRCARLDAESCVGCIEIARFDTRRVGCGDGAAERIVDVGLGFGEVACRDCAGEDAVLGIVGRGDRRVGADAAAGLLSP